MQLDDARKRFLVAAGQIPGDWHARPARSLEYDPIPLDHLLGGKDTSERIVHVNVGTRLVKDEIAMRDP